MKQSVSVHRRTGRWSLPIWERGLKLASALLGIIVYKSLPIWERGLKLKMGMQWMTEMAVAPYMGAWIETDL